MYRARRVSARRLDLIIINRRKALGQHFRDLIGPSAIQVCDTAL
jgi:hypothetical protein